jgi:uncharacterized coiled-coil DUF342 family protein
MFCFPWKSNQIAAAPPPDVDQLYNTMGAPLVNFQRQELDNAEELETIQRCVDHAMSELYMAKQRALSLMGNYRFYHIGWGPVGDDRSNRMDPCFREIILRQRKRELVARRKYAELDAFFQLQTMLSNEKVIVDRLVIDMVCKLAREKVEAVAADELQLAAVDEVAWQVEAARVQAELKKENAALAEKISCLTAREKELEEEVAQLRGEKRDAEAGLQALQVEKESLHSVVLGLRAEKESVHAVVLEVQAEKESMHTAVLELQAEKESMHATVLELQAEKARMEAEILALQLEQGSMKTAIEFQVSEIAELKADLVQSSREAAHYRDRCAVVQRKVSNLSLELQCTRDSVRDLPNGNYRLLITELRADVREAQERLVTLSLSLDVAKGCCDEYSDQIKGYVRRVDELEKCRFRDEVLEKMLRFTEFTFECPITSDSSTSPLVLWCGHVFDSEAAHHWKNISGGNTFCPSCRGPFQIRADVK